MVQNKYIYIYIYIYIQITKYQNNSIKITDRMKPLHKRVKTSHADSGTKNTNALAILCRRGTEAEFQKNSQNCYIK